MMPTRVFSLSLLLCCAVFFTGCSLFKPVDSNRPDLITKGKRDRPDPTGRIRSGIVDHAGELLGIKYKYGGNKPRDGFDCSGLTRFLYQNAGLDLPRVSRDQAVLGRVKKFDDARPGDLVFYRKGRPSKVFHVSIVVDVKPGQLWVVHATSSRGVMREDILASSYWKPKIYQVRDVLN
jgi:cell wall-associated NlpC family hydrolase